MLEQKNRNTAGVGGEKSKEVRKDCEGGN